MKGAFGFIEYDDRKIAKDAMVHIDGMRFAGARVGVDVSGADSSFISSYLFRCQRLGGV